VNIHFPAGQKMTELCAARIIHGVTDATSHLFTACGFRSVSRVAFSAFR
jgi:hypothetical protein